MQIAAEHAEAIGERSRVGVEEGLLLDGVALHAADVSPGDVEFAPAVVTDLADTNLAFGNGAAVPAGIAAQTLAFEDFPEFGGTLVHVLVEQLP